MTTEARLIDLESRLTFQENLIQELQQTTHSQYLIIEKLEKNLKILKDHLNVSTFENSLSHTEKPPHY